MKPLKQKKKEKKIHTLFGPHKFTPLHSSTSCPFAPTVGLKLIQSLSVDSRLSDNRTGVWQCKGHAAAVWFAVWAPGGATKDQEAPVRLCGPTTTPGLMKESKTYLIIWGVFTSYTKLHRDVLSPQLPTVFLLVTKTEDLSRRFKTLS